LHRVLNTVHIIAQSITCHQCLPVDDMSQLDACGYEDGRVVIAYSKFNGKQREIISTKQFQHIQLITALNLHRDQQQDGNFTFDVVAAAAEQVLVLLGNELKDGVIEFGSVVIDLDKVPPHDCVLSVTWIDVDLDGEKELVLGTFGKSLLIFKLSDYNNSKDQSPANSLEPIWERQFSSPLFGLHLMMGSELVCVSRRGIHVLQRQLDMVAERLHTAIQEHKERSITNA
jgi:hypothetical protein